MFADICTILDNIRTMQNNIDKKFALENSINQNWCTYCKQYFIHYGMAI